MKIENSNFTIIFFKVECSDGQIGYGRRKRAISELPPDPNKIFEISITSFIKVGSENGDLMNNEKTYNNKKLIVGNQMSDTKGNINKTYLFLFKYTNKYLIPLNEFTR